MPITEGSRRSEVASCATAIGRIRFHICCIRSGSHPASKTLLVTNEQRCPYNARAKRTDLDTVGGCFNAQRFAKPARSHACPVRRATRVAF